MATTRPCWWYYPLFVYVYFLAPHHLCCIFCISYSHKAYIAVFLRKDATHIISLHHTISYQRTVRFQSHLHFSTLFFFSSVAPFWGAGLATVVASTAELCMSRLASVLVYKLYYYYHHHHQYCSLVTVHYYPDVWTSVVDVTTQAR